VLKGSSVELLAKAGVLIWPIVLCSVVGLALTAQRFFFFRVATRRNRIILKRVLPLVRDDRIEDAAANCEEAKGPLAGVLLTLLGAWTLPREQKENLLTITAEREMRTVEWGLRPLAVIARISPLLGLLGTVLGLVEAFIAFSSGGGQPNPAMLADGIWQALLTTVAGLAVAIPAILAHEWCESKADEQAFLIKQALIEVEGQRAP
jgi:biopolymer transport protein ExbB